MKWLKKISELLFPSPELSVDVYKAEQEYRETVLNPQLQKMEDDSWDRDIEYRAQKMLRDYNHEIEQWKIKHWDMWEKSEHVRMYRPLIIADLPKKSVYTVHDKNTAKYNDTKLIDKKLSERFNQLLKEQEIK